MDIHKCGWCGKVFDEEHGKHICRACHMKVSEGYRFDYSWERFRDKANIYSECSKQ